MAEDLPLNEVVESLEDEGPALIRKSSTFPTAHLYLCVQKGVSEMVVVGN